MSAMDPSPFFRHRQTLANKAKSRQKSSNKKGHAMLFAAYYHETAYSTVGSVFFTPNFFFPRGQLEIM